MENQTSEGPSSLREALEQSFAELSADGATVPESTESGPTDLDAQTATDEVQEAFEEVPPEVDTRGDDNEVIYAPEHWSAEDRETFKGLPSAAQQYLLKREKQYEHGIQQKAEELRPLKEAFGPYRDILKMRGVDEATAVRTWVAAQQMLDTDPVNGLTTLIQQFGPEVREALASKFGNREPVEEDYGDPEVQKLRRELSDLKRQNSQSQMQYQQLRQQEALAQVRDFREATDADGKPLHPHFDEVSDDMRALLSAGTAPDLKTAYEKAVWALPAYREEFAAKQKQQVTSEQSKARERAAAKAKKTAAAVNGKGSVPPPPSKPKTLRDELAEAYNLSVKGEL